MGIQIEEMFIYRWIKRRKSLVKLLFLTIAVCSTYVMIAFHKDLNASERLNPIISMMKSGFHLDSLKDFAAISDDEKYDLMNNMRDSIHSLLNECRTAKPVCDNPGQGSKLLTLFTTWVYDEDKFPINYKTLKNWRTLLTNVNLIVFTNSTKVADHSKAVGFSVLPIVHDVGGIPVLPAMFIAAKAEFKSEFYGYSNADILFTDSLTKTLNTILCNIEERSRKQGLLIVGRRINVPAVNISVQDVNSSTQLAEISKSSGSLFQTDAEDYFITDKFYRWDSFLPVIIGRRGYDNWVVAYSRYNHITVIDATESILCVHQTLESRGNYEGLSKSLSKASYNMDLVEKLQLPFSFPAWGRTWCSDIKTWLDLCGEVVISERKKVNNGCTSYYWWYSLQKLIGWQK